MKTYRAAQSRYGARMLVKEFGDLYACLMCFYRTYAIEEEAVKHVLDVVAYAYSTEYEADDPDAISRLRNLRGAGRNSKFTEEDRQKVKELAKAKLSVREIAEKTGISKSTVQRML